MEAPDLDLDSPPLADRCPFSRNFGPGFHGCVAYTQEEFTALDTGYHPLRPVLTCRHLAIGSEAEGGFYPRCALGAAEDRERWADEVGIDRLGALRRLSVEYRSWVGDLMPSVWETKGRLLAARAEKRDTEAPAQEFRAQVDGLLQAADGWIDAHAPALADVGLDPEILKSLIATATKEWVDSPHGGLGYQVPDAVLEQFPHEIQVFIRAGRG